LILLREISASYPAYPASHQPLSWLYLHVERNEAGSTGEFIFH
jgi:hypothetical protein